MDREMLEQPFDAKFIKQRKGRNNMTLDYIETHSVIQRLNDALDGNWSFEIVEFQQMGEEAVVLGKLTADGIVKQQFGSATIVRAKNTNEIISIGDDFKSATSDCLKKCATLLGVGLHLYGELPDTTYESTNATNKDATTDNGNGNNGSKPKTNMENITGNLGNNLITPEQLAQIKKIRTEHKLTPEDVQSKCQRLFGTMEVTALNTVMATALIANISGNGGNGSK
jgi:hypothetical protein